MGVAAGRHAHDPGWDSDSRNGTVPARTVFIRSIGPLRGRLEMGPTHGPRPASDRGGTGEGRSNLGPVGRVLRPPVGAARVVDDCSCTHSAFGAYQIAQRSPRLLWKIKGSIGPAIGRSIRGPGVTVGLAPKRRGRRPATKRPSRSRKSCCGTNAYFASRLPGRTDRIRLSAGAA